MFQCMHIRRHMGLTSIHARIHSRVCNAVNHADSHINIDTYACAYKHTYLQCTRMHIFMHTHKYTHTFVHSCIHTPRQRDRQVYTPSNILSYTYTLPSPVRPHQNVTVALGCRVYMMQGVLFVWCWSVGCIESGNCYCRPTWCQQKHQLLQVALNAAAVLEDQGSQGAGYRIQANVTVTPDSTSGSTSCRRLEPSSYAVHNIMCACL